MPKIVTVDWECDRCGAELEGDEVLLARLPLHRGSAATLRAGASGLERPAHEGVYCSWDCLAAAVIELRAAA